MAEEKLAKRFFRQKEQQEVDNDLLGRATMELVADWFRVPSIDRGNELLGPHLTADRSSISALCNTLQRRCSRFRLFLFCRHPTRVRIAQ